MVNSPCHPVKLGVFSEKRFEGRLGRATGGKKIETMEEEKGDEAGGVFPELCAGAGSARAPGAMAHLGKGMFWGGCLAENESFKVEEERIDAGLMNGTDRHE